MTLYLHYSRWISTFYFRVVFAQCVLFLDLVQRKLMLSIDKMKLYVSIAGCKLFSRRLKLLSGRYLTISRKSWRLKKITKQIKCVRGVLRTPVIYGVKLVFKNILQNKLV